MSRWGERSSLSTATPSTTSNRKNTLPELEDLSPLPQNFQKTFLRMCQEWKSIAESIKNENNLKNMQSFSGGGSGESFSGIAINDASGRRKTIAVQVPASRAGLIIGPKGETLKRIEKQSQCRVVLDQTSSLSEDTQTRIVTITGCPEDINEAKRLVLEKVNDVEGGSNPSTEVRVPQNRVGLVIGKGGDTIRELQEKSGAKVVVQSEHDVDRWASHRLVYIQGDKAQVEQARQWINDLVCGKARGGYLGVQEADGQSVTITIPETSVGAIIGKKAETLRTLQTMSGARIYVEGESGADGLRPVHVTGAPEQIAYANQLIHERVAANEGTSWIQPISASSGGDRNPGSASGVVYQDPSEFIDPSQYFYGAGGGMDAYLPPQ